MCYDEGEEGFDLQSRWQRARQEHKCFACREVIRPGDRYHLSVQKYDDIRHFKHCARCWGIVEALLRAGADSVQWDLNCGTAFEEAFGPLPDDVATLAFLTRDEAQLRAEEGK
jgi:hypothetical protein